MTMQSSTPVQRMLDSFIWEDKVMFWAALAKAVEDNTPESAVALVTLFRAKAVQYGYTLETKMDMPEWFKAFIDAHYRGGLRNFVGTFDYRKTWEDMPASIKSCANSLQAASVWQELVKEQLEKQ